MHVTVYTLTYRNWLVLLVSNFFFPWKFFPKYRKFWHLNFKQSHLYSVIRTYKPFYDLLSTIFSNFQLFMQKVVYLIQFSIFKLKNALQFEFSAYLNHKQVAFSNISLKALNPAIHIQYILLLHSLSLHESQDRHADKSILLLRHRETLSALYRW